MTALGHTLLVAGWEFRRYFKWRDQILGLLVFLALAGAAYGAGCVATSGGRTLTVGVEGVGPAALTALADPTSRLRFVPAPAPDLRREALRQGTLHGILRATGDGTFDLLVENDPRYLGELRTRLTEVLQRERLAARGISAADLQQLLAPATVQVQFADPRRGRVGRGEQLLAGIAVALVMLALFTGMAYLLTGITGEKQLRVTESIVSIVPPQAWIDGKILGIGAYAIANMLNMMVGGLIVAGAARLAWGFTLPDAAVRPGILLLLLVSSLLALLLWNAFFAAFAATIDDPNTSARTSFMFVPVLFVGVACWVVLRDPDSTVSRVLTVFPLTSAPALPVRAILADVSLLEGTMSIVLLVGTIWLVRRAAGRIFEIGMLMYGKEPSLGEVLRWMRAR